MYHVNGSYTNYIVYLRPAFVWTGLIYLLLLLFFRGEAIGTVIEHLGLHEHDDNNIREVLLKKLNWLITAVMKNKKNVERIENINLPWQYLSNGYKKKNLKIR